ncbi:hypothetical protein SSP24_28740 [Streptomyces spinoverrucosus]|uniref:Uncharacterized protein n=1 Tax=Streptomyces spinoverrucosus TaxID=284043 RepID=A0A4Y3VHS2_9ACTN|nr:hypothetical protein [Streptomyces spinoverrucosus]GEC05219.1 hypothetical protein SSP24_28740 [Streptomyces spinoverrucosus]GHB72703.1 hypothetical protein GCM10010397_48910 [Streptomyces spinoverrucosus]
MLRETIRQYGAQKRAAGGVEQHVRLLHCDFYRFLAERMADDWHGSGEEEGLELTRVGLDIQRGARKDQVAPTGETLPDQALASKNSVSAGGSELRSQPRPGDSAAEVRLCD